MKIKKKLNQYRRDFRAVYECEHCSYNYEGSGYDDANFHNNVIPAMQCPDCGKSASSTYCPMKTVYPEGTVV